MAATNTPDLKRRDGDNAAKKGAGEREHPAAQKFVQWCASLLRDRGMTWTAKDEDFEYALAILREGGWSGAQSATLGYIKRRGATAHLDVYDVFEEWEAYAEIGKQWLVSLRGMRERDTASQQLFESRRQAKVTYDSARRIENENTPASIKAFMDGLAALAPDPGPAPTPELPREWTAFDDLLQGHMPDPDAPYIGEMTGFEDDPAPEVVATVSGLPLLPDQKYWDVLMVLDKESCAMSLTQVAETARVNKQKAHAILEQLASQMLIESEKRSHIITPRGRDAVQAWRARHA